MVKMGKIIVQKIAATMAAKYPDCEKFICELLSGIETSDAEAWEVDQERIPYIIADTAVEQWRKLDINIPKDYDRKRIIDALATGIRVKPDPNDGAESGAHVGLLDDIDLSSIIRSLDPRPRPQDLKKFVLSVLYSFKPIYLQKGAEYSTGSDGRLVEGAWQKEFYRAATTILPSGMYISPEANTTLGIVDFYVHTQDKKIKWCIELVREGDLLDENVQKFEKRDEGEQLSDKPSKKGADCDDYMILDFREAGKIGVDEEKAKSYAKVWFAIYSEAFTSISVSCFEPTTSKLRTIKTIKLPEEGHVQCSAFEQLQNEITLKCKDHTIAKLRSYVRLADEEDESGYESTCSIERDDDNTNSIEDMDSVENMDNVEDITSKWLDDEDINKVIKLIKNQFQNWAGLHNCLIGHSYRSFPKTEGTFIQILHVNGNHWITVQHAEPQSGIVHVYDSIYESASEDAKRQIAALLRTEDKRIVLKIHKTQYQKGCTDCGLFAVAFATDLAHRCNPSKRLYKQNHLRSHFITCLSEQKMTPFPSTVQKPGRPKTEYIEVFCTCRLPANGSMVQCSKCNEKYHASCIGTSPTPFWKCSACTIQGKACKL